jgi:hypothetical protein
MNEESSQTRTDDDLSALGIGGAPIPNEPTISVDVVREAVLALEGSVISDLTLPLPGDLRDISKAAALISGVVEDRIPEMLNRVRSTTWDEDGRLGAYEFRRFTIGFPDILLVERANPDNVLFEIEAKSWYILSRDALTARFLTSSKFINPGTLVIIVGWMLDGVVSGSPALMRIHVADAAELAKQRDAQWTDVGEDHRVQEPDNAPDTPRNLTRTQVDGEIRGSDGKWRKNSDNFGKLDRIPDSELRAFRDSTLTVRAAGKPLADWRAFIAL